MNTKTYVILTVAVVAVAVAAFVYINKDNKSSAQIAADMSGNPSEAGSQTNASASPADNGGAAAGDTLELPGVEVTVIKAGSGPVAEDGESVSVNYTGELADGTVFDSNTDPKFSHVQPFTFNLGAGQVIRGWDEGVAGMKVGEERKLVISPDYAYGADGISGVIPPNATLTFDVTLLSIGNSSSQGGAGQNASGQ
jgi:FKBP-type peptidyl-prolyl cis-trans isomerase